VIAKKLRREDGGDEGVFRGDDFLLRGGHEVQLPAKIFVILAEDPGDQATSERANISARECRLLNGSPFSYIRSHSVRILEECTVRFAGTSGGSRRSHALYQCWESQGTAVKLVTES
jgi:hypothetical protein